MKRDSHPERQSAAEDGYGGIFQGYIVLTSHYPDGKIHSEQIGAAFSPAVDILPTTQDYSRYCDRPMSWGERFVGATGTCAIFALIIASALFTWQSVHPPVASVLQPINVVDLSPLAAPPEPVKDVAPGPEQVDKQVAKPKPVAEVVPPPLVQLTAPSVPTREVSEPVELVDPGLPIPETTAPKSIAAPPSRRASIDAEPNWEALLLAHLERFRRYPARARAAREQGVAYIRFTMNRAGTVLSSSIVRKSGSYTLDQGALDTLKRAQPLPAIPADRPDIIELTIPVEFYLLSAPVSSRRP